MKEMIDGMREWSKSRARRASLGGDSEREPSEGRKLEI